MRAIPLPQDQKEEDTETAFPSNTHAYPPEGQSTSLGLGRISPRMSCGERKPSLTRLQQQHPYIRLYTPIPSSAWRALKK